MVTTSGWLQYFHGWLHVYITACHCWLFSNNSMPQPFSCLTYTFIHQINHTVSKSINNLNQQLNKLELIKNYYYYYSISDAYRIFVMSGHFNTHITNFITTYSIYIILFGTKTDLCICLYVQTGSITFSFLNLLFSYYILRAIEYNHVNRHVTLKHMQESPH